MAHLRVHETDASIVGLQHFAAKVVRQLVLFPLVAAQRRRRQVGLVLLDSFDHAHLRQRIVAEVRIFGGNVGRMRPVESDGQEERPLFLLGTPFQHPSGVGGHHAVRMVLVALRRSVPTERAAELSRSEREDMRLFLHPVAARRVQFQFPRTRIVVPVGADRFGHVVVVQLADPRGEVALLSKRLRQTDVRGDCLAEDLGVAQNAAAVRIQPREHRIAARSAQRKLAVSPLEGHAASRQPVDVRRPGQRIAVAAEHVVQVVRNQKQHVRSAGVSGPSRSASQRQQRQYSKARKSVHRAAPRIVVRFPTSDVFRGAHCTALVRRKHPSPCRRTGRESFSANA